MCSHVMLKLVMQLLFHVFTVLKLGCITNFIMIGFFHLVNKMRFVLINSSQPIFFLILVCGLFCCRLAAIARDAELEDYPMEDLSRMADILHDGCVKAVKDYDEKLLEDPNFDGNSLTFTGSY